MVNQTFPKYQGNIRWKILEKVSGFLSFRSPFREFWWRKDNNIIDHPSTSQDSQQGFHVYLFKQTAINAAKKIYCFENCPIAYIVKLKCHDFIAGGIIDHCDDYSDGKRGERWGRADILNVYDLDGNDVTNNFFKD